MSKRLAIERSIISPSSSLLTKCCIWFCACAFQCPKLLRSLKLPSSGRIFLGRPATPPSVIYKLFKNKNRCLKNINNAMTSSCAILKCKHRLSAHNIHIRGKRYFLFLTLAFIWQSLLLVCQNEAEHTKQENCKHIHSDLCLQTLTQYSFKLKPHRHIWGWSLLQASGTEHAHCQCRW